MYINFTQSLNIPRVFEAVSSIFYLQVTGLCVIALQNFKLGLL